MKLFLIDGHALIFKMYYAFLGRPMLNGKGEDTSVIFGFTKYLLDLIEKEKPTHIAVAFDPPGGTFRNVLYPAYKANRPPTPKLVTDALEPLTEIVKALGIPVLMIKGYEADDVIGSVAKHTGNQDTDVFMVTPDKDYGQLIDSHIFQYKPAKAGNGGEILGVNEICAKYSIKSPLQVIDILTLCGDTSDNVPGVRGVGPVGASKLLARYGNVENIYAHIGELSPKQQEAFNAASDHISLSKKLVTIDINVPVTTAFEQMLLKESIGSDIMNYIDFYEMPSLRKVISRIWKIENEGKKAETESPAIEEIPWEECLKSIKKTGFCSVVTEEGRVCLATKQTGSVISLESLSSASEKGKAFMEVLKDENIAKCGYDIKQTVKILDARGIALKGKLTDPMILHYLLNPERSHDLELLCGQYLGTSLENTDGDLLSNTDGNLFAKEEKTGEDLFAKEEKTGEDLFAKEAGPGEDLSTKATKELVRRSTIECRLGMLLLLKVDEAGLKSLYDEIEEPLIGVLARMEEAGVLVDLSVLQEFADQLRKEIADCESKVRQESGEPYLNLSSPKQVGELLFGKLHIDPKLKKPSKGSWPTDEETLLKYEDKTPLIGKILQYRASKKLLSTYIEPFPDYMDPADGRIHTNFNQALTATGRLSSSKPNLQNIPIRTEQGKEIRRAFKASKGCVIMSADYSQIELRLMAHYCGDAHMIGAFKEGLDIHAAMAAKIFHKPIKEVSPQERRIAKTANFGIMYGISSFGLASRLHISRSEAAGIIDDYFASFPAIREFIATTLDNARKEGYVQTLFGRKRFVPDVNSHNANLRAMAERNAVNAPIQGSAADIIKLAMIAVDKALRDKALHSRMVLQIHDELVLEVPKAEIGDVRQVLKDRMENAAKLNVPLIVECNYGDNWLEAHS